MSQQMQERIMALFRAVRTDPQYMRLSGEYEKLQEQFALLTGKYPLEEQDILWGFVCISEEMNWQMLEWLCQRYDIEA